MSESPNGYQIDLYTSLVTPVHLGGVPRRLAILLWMVAAILTFPLQLPWIGVPFGLAGHAVAAYLTKRDPWFFDVLSRHLRQPSHWD